jgi:hypothetical protein
LVRHHRLHRLTPLQVLRPKLLHCQMHLLPPLPRLYSFQFFIFPFQGIKIETYSNNNRLLYNDETN